MIWPWNMDSSSFNQSKFSIRALHTPQCSIIHTVVTCSSCNLLQSKYRVQSGAIIRDVNRGSDPTSRFSISIRTTSWREILRNPSLGLLPDVKYWGIHHSDYFLTWNFVECITRTTYWREILRNPSPGLLSDVKFWGIHQLDYFLTWNFEESITWTTSWREILRNPSPGLLPDVECWGVHHLEYFLTWNFEESITRTASWR